MKTFQASDTGDLNRLSHLLVPKTLHLKIGAPVMLQVNLSRTMVNGLRGYVKVIDEECVTVFFPQINRSEGIQKYNFTVYDREQGKDVACRSQIPLRLAFAMTVHKAKGLTMSHLIIDCRHMSNPGQIGVAVDRATNIENLQVLNFNRKYVKKHKSEIDEYYSKNPLLLKDDLSCCKQKFASQHEDIQELPSSDLYNKEQLDDDSDSDIEFRALVEGDEFLHNFDKEQNEEQSSSPLHLCPSDLDLDTMIDSLCYNDPVTEQQHDLNSDLRQILCNSGCFKAFVDKIWNKFYLLFLQIVPQTEGTPQNKQMTELYKEITLFIQSKRYLNMVRDLFGCYDLKSHHTRCVFSVVEYLRAFMMKEVSKPIFRKAEEMAKMSSAGS